MEMKCPFCNGEGEINCNDDPREYQYYVHCLSCGADGGWSKTEGGAIKNWNMRSK